MIKWHEPENSNEFLTFEDVDKMMKSYNSTEFRQQYLNEPQVDAGRRTGNTTRDLKHLCELLVSGNTKIYCKIKRHRDFGYMSQMFADIVKKEAYRNFGTRLILLNVEESFSRITTNFGILEFFVKAKEEEFFRGKDRSLPVVSLIDY
jgi:hypothetical protein